MHWSAGIRRTQAIPSRGVSAQLIASEITRAIEGNPELCDRAGGEVSPPPFCLEAKDLRGGYEVTTPERVWVAFDWLSHHWSAKDLLISFERSVTDAASEAASCFNYRAQAYGAMLGTAQSALVPAAEIISLLSWPIAFAP
ncbi:arginine utilization protein RocB [Mesorhizobium shonense]|uniref:Arginine utilization protein RocB n=1 Tax=Mesorhizobium shonense TaxID=1209948 RepID=A0ABV2I622_9HYPH